MAHEFQITPPDLVTFTTGPEAAANKLVVNAKGGATEMARFLLDVAASRLQDEGGDPMAVRNALDGGDLSITVAAYNTSRQPDPDAPISLSGAAQIGQFVQQGDTIKLSYQRRGVQGRSTTYTGLTFRERQTTDGRMLWLPARVWADGDDGEPILLDILEGVEPQDPQHYDSVAEVLPAPLTMASLALHTGVIAMKKPAAGTGVPKLAVDITSGYLL